MKLKTGVIFLFPVLTSNAFADQYSTFRATRFYFANRRYFVEVRENKRAALYRDGRIARRIWRRQYSD